MGSMCVCSCVCVLLDMHNDFHMWAPFCRLFKTQPSDANNRRISKNEWTWWKHSKDMCVSKRLLFLFLAVHLSLSLSRSVVENDVKYRIFDPFETEPNRTAIESLGFCVPTKFIYTSRNRLQAAALLFSLNRQNRASALNCKRCVCSTKWCCCS